MKKEVSMIDLPDYLVEVVVHQIYTEQYPSNSYPLWEEADNVTKNGCKEMARMQLHAKSMQQDIKR
jgi:hypothetical protein